MTDTVVNMGEKGQILIPKLLREEFGLLPGQPAVLQETEEGVLVKRIKQDPVKLFESIAKKANIKAKKIESVEEQYAERMIKAGIKL